MSLQRPETQRLRRLHWVALAGILFIAWLLAGSFEVALIPTASMESTILVGDHVLVNKLFDSPEILGTGIRLPRLRRQARRNEIISLKISGQTAVYLKRVIAVGGDLVELRDDTLLVNGTPVHQQDIPTAQGHDTMTPRRVPRGEVFVLGDNRDHSEDSRDWGTIPVSAIVGSPVMVCWSYRADSDQWLDASGNVRLSFYWTAARNLFHATRWSRLGTTL